MAFTSGLRPLKPVLYHHKDLQMNLQNRNESFSQSKTVIAEVREVNTKIYEGVSEPEIDRWC